MSYRGGAIGSLDPTSGVTRGEVGDRGGLPATNAKSPGSRALKRHHLILLFFLPVSYCEGEVLRPLLFSSP